MNTYFFEFTYKNHESRFRTTKILEAPTVRDAWKLLWARQMDPARTESNPNGFWLIGVELIYTRFPLKIGSQDLG